MPGRELCGSVFRAYTTHIMQDTNKNAIWIFGVIIVVLGIIWATSSKPKTASEAVDTATTTADEMAADYAASGSDLASMNSSADEAVTTSSGSTVKSPMLPAAGIGPKN